MTKSVLDKVMYAVFIVVIASAFVLWKNMNDQFNAYVCNPDPVIVQEGDSMYEIAVANCSGNVPNAVDDLVLEYGFTEIYPGQQLWLSSKP
jgi:hypothetical protein